MDYASRLRQYLGKASFSNACDKQSALECVDEMEKEHDRQLAHQEQLLAEACRFFEPDDRSAEKIDWLKRAGFMQPS